MLNPDDFKTISDWLLGGYWPDMRFEDVNGNVLDTKEFGDNDFHGRTHPAIAYMALTRFTEPGDMVLIPFAGSGTEIDICKKYNRRYFALDINPQRDDIVRGDATRLGREFHGYSKLIIAHPPYEDVVDYGKDARNLSVRGIGYERLVDKCCHEFYDALYDNGILVVIIGAVYRDKQEIPLDYVWYRYATRAGFGMIGRIVRDFGETKGKGKNKNLWKYRLIKFKRFKLENDFVLIFQKGL
jgi:DNA modification methylase